MLKSDLLRCAAERYDAFEMDALPLALQRNSLHYHYLSIYPSLGELVPLLPETRPSYPDAIHNAYIHIPFCSGVCDFCSYYLQPVSVDRDDRIDAYLKLVEQELAYHARHATLDISYLFIGGGTPSLIPPDSLDRLLSYMSDRGYLNPGVMGTVELHPEFFNDRKRAKQFLAVMERHHLRRVSIGYQLADETLLAAARRRHTSTFLDDAMALLRDEGLLVNLDLMYGLAGQSLESWEATLSAAIAAVPDSISTYYLFVSQGTALVHQVSAGRLQLPDHRHVQLQHLMAQHALEASGYYELPNDFYARNVAGAEHFRQEYLPSEAVMLPIGPGAYGHYDGTQIANVFDLPTYRRLIEAGDSPLWRGYRLSPEEALRRDIMFSFKNDPYLDLTLFDRHYGTGPLTAFPALFERLFALDLVVAENGRLRLTRKGRLVVEEIAQLFRIPDLAVDKSRWNGEGALLEKHHFASTYPRVAWPNGRPLRAGR